MQAKFITSQQTGVLKFHDKQEIVCVWVASIGSWLTSGFSGNLWLLMLKCSVLSYVNTVYSLSQINISSSFSFF